MANIGISRASYFAENAVSKLQVSKSNSMQRLASAQANKSAGEKASLNNMTNRFKLGLAETKSAIKNMTRTQGYLATTMNVLDRATSILAKLQDLAVLGANGANSSAEHAAIDTEADALMDRFHDVIQNSTYKGMSVFNNSDGFSKMAVGNSSQISFGVASLYYDELYDHTNPSEPFILPGTRYEITKNLTDDDKAEILAKTSGITADQLVPGFQFETISLPEPVTPDVVAVNDTSSVGTEVPNMGLLQNMLVKAGVNSTTGTLGSGGTTQPGLMYDATGAGNFNDAYDYLTPGSPFDGFALKISGTNSTNNNDGNQADISSVSFQDQNNQLIWTGNINDANGNAWEVKHTYTLGSKATFVDIKTEIIAGSDASDVSFGRFIDPDARAAPGDTSATENVIGYGTVPKENIVFSEANESLYALGLYSTDPNVTSGTTQPWSSQADGYNGTHYATGAYGSGDDTIGMSWKFSDVQAGQKITANYSYIFGVGAYQAARDAFNAGAGGGQDVTGGKGIVNVGSATEAAKRDFGDKLMLAPALTSVDKVSAGSGLSIGETDNDGDASTPVSAINTSKIELIQQRINKMRTLLGSQYAAISSAMEFSTDLSSQYSLGTGSISDVNFSMETVHLAKDRMQQDAAAAILAQANKAQEGLMLLV